MGSAVAKDWSALMGTARRTAPQRTLRSQAAALAAALAVACSAKVTKQELRNEQYGVHMNLGTVYYIV